MLATALMKASAERYIRFEIHILQGEGVGWCPGFHQACTEHPVTQGREAGGVCGEGVELAARIPEETRSSHLPSGTVM